MATGRDRPHGFREALGAAREILGASLELVSKGSIEAEAEQLVVAAYRMETGKVLSRMELFTRLGDRFPEKAGDRLLLLAGARAEGKPLQHLTGYQAFLDHEYEVGPDVLIPRPETEVLVVHAIETLRGEATKPSMGIEIGAGSGVISIELLAAFPGLRMLASELTAEAAVRAEQNARRILGEGAERLQLLRAREPLEVLSPFGEPLAGRRADFIISNPPYLSSPDQVEAEVLRHEPATALFAPEGAPLHFYDAVAKEARHYLKDDGQVFMELAHERAAETKRLFESRGWRRVSLLPDLTGRPRVLVASSGGIG